MKKLFAFIIVIVFTIQLSACGGLHDGTEVTAVDLISNAKIKISIWVHNTADTSEFSNFSSPLSYNEMARELRGRNNIISVTDFDHAYLRLETENGEFYLKECGFADGETLYSLFAEVGRASEFGENIYIPFHMLDDYENSDCPAYAAPFDGSVYFNSKEYTIKDFADYYKSKEIYSVEADIDGSTLNITDKRSGYSFRVKAADFGDYGMFSLEDDLY